ncbi:hypothetical protein [Caviibacter abscessus]|uniref:hypothetical protein n=1 Tax=Caviibacter abscessus TaxID=1766719 RepID=UPI0008336142|nr:hypothetical protein [Caviibacter abscessus]
MSGELQAKYLKSFILKEDLKIKIGVGSSIYIQYDKPLTTGFKPKKKDINNDSLGDNNPSIPTIGSGVASYLSEQINLLYQLQQEESVSHNTYFKNLTGMVNLAKGHFDANFTIFGTLEIEKIVNPDFSIYVGSDLGVDIALHHCIAESDSQPNTSSNFKYVLERRKFVLPHARGYFGIDYKNFEIEVGAGYPKFITLGFGYRFKF